MNAHGSLCYHDSIACQVPLDVDAGISDPTIGSFWPEQALGHDCPRICISRDDWRPAMEAWSDTEITDEVAAIANENIKQLAHMPWLLNPSRILLVLRRS
jgi:hypothetical protein